MTHAGLHEAGALEGPGGDHREHLGECLDSGAQGGFEQPFLGAHEPVLGDRFMDGFDQDFVGTGFAEVAKDGPLVDCGDRRGQVGLAGEQDAHAVGAALTHLGQKSGAVHARHAHVGYHHLEWRTLAQCHQASFAAASSEHFELAVKTASQRRQDIGLVVDAEYPWQGFVFTHELCSSGLMPFAATRAGARAPRPLRGSPRRAHGRRQGPPRHARFRRRRDGGRRGPGRGVAPPH